MDLDELERLANEATPGPWVAAYHIRTESWALTFKLPDCDEVNDDLNVLAKAPDSGSQWSDDFEYIAAADPQTMLRLIKVVKGALAYKASQTNEQGEMLYPESFDDTELIKALEALDAD